MTLAFWPRVRCNRLKRGLDHILNLVYFISACLNLYIITVIANISFKMQITNIIYIF
jgi:hypothetical protein